MFTWHGAKYFGDDGEKVRVEKLGENGWHEWDELMFTFHILTRPYRPPVVIKWYDRPHKRAHATEVTANGSCWSHSRSPRRLCCALLGEGRWRARGGFWAVSGRLSTALSC